MAELTTIARPYAEAAFRIARDENALPAWSEMLRFASTVVGDARVAAALDNPKLTVGRQGVARAVRCAATSSMRSGATSSACWSRPTAWVCCRRSATLFEALKNDIDGVAKARIDSAFPLTDAQLGELTAALEKHFAKKIEATVNVDPALIGGARITVGDTVIDASVEAQLQAMATRLRA